MRDIVALDQGVMARPGFGPGVVDPVVTATGSLAGERGPQDHPGNSAEVATHGIALQHGREAVEFPQRGAEPVGVA